MDEYAKLAKNAVEFYVKTGKTPDIPKGLPDVFYREKRGVFVTIYKRSNPEPGKKSLRGCIGTYMPTKENIAREIIDNAISSASCDYRFCPVAENELDKLNYEINLLHPPEPVSSLENLDPKTYGIIVRSQDGRTGLLLPDIEGIDTPQHQIRIACQKAKINLETEKIELYRFVTEKHT